MKKLSLILAIVMIATAFCMVVPFTAMADEDLGPEVEINGIPEENLSDALMLGLLDDAQDDVYIKLLRDVEWGAAILFDTKLTKADGSPVKVTVDLNGYTVTSAAGNFIRLGIDKDTSGINEKENHLVFKNGYINYSGKGSVFQLFTYGQVDIENLVITCAESINYCVFNTMTGPDTTGKKMVVNITNVEVTMPALAGTSQCSFVRTGNPGAEPALDPSSEYNINNCNFNTVGDAPASNGARGFYLTSSKSVINVTNTTFSSPAQVVYASTSVQTAHTAEDGVTVTPTAIFTDCEYTFLGAEGAEVIHNEACFKFVDNEGVENGFKGFELPKAPETTKPAETETPATSATTPDVSTPDTNTPDSSATTPDTNAPGTDAPGTDAPGTDAPGTDKPAETNKPAGGGCGGFTAAASFLALICGAGAALIIKKK